MRIRIATIVSTLEHGGPTTVLFNLLKNLDREFDRFVVTLSPEPPRSRWEDFERLGVELFCMNFNRFDWLFQGGYRINQQLARISPQLVHTHSLRPDIISARYLATRRRVSTIHGNLEAAYGDTYGRYLGKKFAERQIKAIGNLERKVACSKAVFEIYRSQVPDLQCIPNGVDTDTFRRRSDAERSTFRERLDLPLDKKIFISVGGLTELKDPLTVINGFLNADTADSSLVILGHGPLSDSIHRLSDNVRVFVRGFSDKVSDYYAASDFFISASRSEGLPNTVLEAMSTGLPCILSDIAPHKEIIGGHDAGVLFECRSTKDLTIAINKMLGSDHKTKSDAASRLIDELYSAKKMAEQYQNLYFGLL